MARGKRKAPTGCYWREGVLWGRIKKAGGDIRWSLHTSNADIARQARDARLKEINDEIHHGIEPKRTIDAVILEWAKFNKGSGSPKTATRYGASLRMLEPTIGGKTLGEITVKLLNIYVDARMAAGVTNATIKRDLVALSQVLKFAIRRGYTESNAAFIVMKGFKERKHLIYLPEPAHIQMVLDRLPAGIAKMALAAWRTGCREGELIAATESAVDHGRKQFTVVGKRNKRRTIDLTPFDGYEVFVTRSGIGETPLFPKEDGGVYKSMPVRFAECVQSVEKRAAKEGISFRPFRFHDLRHRHAVDWLKDGRSIYDLQQRLGHSSVKTTEIYLDFITGDEKKVAMYGAAHG